LVSRVMFAIRSCVICRNRRVFSSLNQLNTFHMHRNAKRFHGEHSPVYSESVRLRHYFKGIVRDFRSQCIQMVQKRSQQDLKKDIQSLYDKEKIEALTPTVATLLVVPKPLFNHWHVSIYFLATMTNKMLKNIPNSVQFSSWVYAQRRWAMTGTPTPQTNRNSDLRNILGLMKFLQHRSFSSDDL